MRASARRLFDDLAARHCGKSLNKQEDSRNRKEREQTQSEMEARRDTHYPECEDNGERRISGLGKRTRSSLRVLTSQIKQVRTIQALLCTYKTHESHFNGIHLSACWMSLGQLARQSTQRERLQDSSEAVGSLVKRTVQAARTGDISAR